MCSHLIGANEKPACVKACCGKARQIIDAGDLGAVSEYNRAAGAANVHNLPDEGNGPTGRYVLSAKNAKWQERRGWQFFPETAD
jgi:Fe-S-cluster-containing dehydrogenase component